MSMIAGPQLFPCHCIYRTNKSMCKLKWFNTHDKVKDIRDLPLKDAYKKKKQLLEIEKKTGQFKREALR